MPTLDRLLPHDERKTRPFEMGSSYQMQQLRSIGFKVKFASATRYYRRYAKGFEGLELALWMAETPHA